MPTIANLNVKADGSFEGTLATLNVTAQIAIVPNGRKAKDNAARPRTTNPIIASSAARTASNLAQPGSRPPNRPAPNISQ